MELERPGTTPAQLRLEERLPSWRTAKLGDVLAATVVHAGRPGHVTLRISGATVHAETSQALTPGQQITVRVTGIGTRPTLEIIAGDATRASVPSASPPPISLTGFNGPRPGPNQRLFALVISAAADGTVQLQTPQGRITARASPPLTAGQLIQIETSSGRHAMTVTAAADTAELIPQQLRAVLPRQATLTPLLATLAAATRGQSVANGSLPAPALAAAANLWSALPVPRDIASPAGLKRALIDSGVFLENRLMAAAPVEGIESTGTDFKAGLLRLIDALLHGASAAAVRTAPPAGNAPMAPPLRGADLHAPACAAAARFANSEDFAAALLQQAEGALARLHTSQLAALPTHEQAQPWLAFELPVRNGNHCDLFQLRIERERAGSGDDGNNAHQWVIHLAFDLDTLGPVYARVTLRGQQISTLFWAERPATVALFVAHLAELQLIFTGAGLAVGALHCQQGRPPRPPASPGPELLTGLKV